MKATIKLERALQGPLLTQKEQSVAFLIGICKCNAEIMSHWAIKEVTVKKHIKNIYKNFLYCINY